MNKVAVIIFLQSFLKKYLNALKFYSIKRKQTRVNYRVFKILHLRKLFKGFADEIKR